MKTKTLRFRMMVLFCTIVSVMLVASYLAFWGLLAHAIPTQLNHQLQETGRLLIADIAAEPEGRDIERLDIPGEFFELLDPEGQVLQRSRNLPAPIHLKLSDPAATHSTFSSRRHRGRADCPSRDYSLRARQPEALPGCGHSHIRDQSGARHVWEASF